MIKLPPRLIYAIALIALSIIALIGTGTHRSILPELVYSPVYHSNTANNGILSSEKGWQILNEIRLTRFVAHAPGFSVIENL